MTQRTLFPVLQAGKVHAAFLVNEPRDEWATRCGKHVKKPEDVQLQHDRAEVECPDCEFQIERGLLARGGQQ